MMHFFRQYLMHCMSANYKWLIISLMNNHSACFILGNHED